MRFVTPSYYKQFACIADRCRHSCCVGWDVVVDDNTAAYYRTVGGALGERLTACLTTDTDGDTCFAMREDGRCPFLNDRGLCDIIRELGEQGLCQICDDHPRFYRVFSDREEAGLGLCCEAAAELILRQADNVTLVGDSEETPTADEAAFFKARDALFAIAQDRSRSPIEREAELLERVGRDPAPLSDKCWRDIYEPLERLDESWTVSLANLTATKPSALYVPDTAFEQLTCYFLYRHLDPAQTPDERRAVVAFAVRSTQLLRRLCEVHGGTLDALLDLARQYSAEVEYDTDNVDILCNTF